MYYSGNSRVGIIAIIERRGVMLPLTSDENTSLAFIEGATSEIIVYECHFLAVESNLRCPKSEQFGLKEG